MKLDELAEQLYAKERVDISRFQRRARILQSMWREEQGYPIGLHGSGENARPIGSRLEMPWAEQTLANYLTEGIRQIVRDEVPATGKGDGRLFGRPRIYNDLLSSQPLCFNLFGELRSDLETLSSLVSDLTDGRFPRVTAIDFEYSPGRRDARYLSDRSAFDVFLSCETRKGTRGFIGIALPLSASVT